MFLVAKSADGKDESQIQLAGKYTLNADLVGGIKSIAGVNDVELV